MHTMSRFLLVADPDGAARLVSYGLNYAKAEDVESGAPALVTFTSYARTAQGLLEIREFTHRLGKRLEEAEATGTPVAVSSVTALGAR